MNDTVATEDQEQPATPHERKARSHDRDPDSRTPSRPADICSASTGRTYDRSRPNRSKRQNSACHGGPSTYEELGVKRIVSWRQWQISNICLSGIQGPEPDCMTRLVSEHDQPHIRSPFATAAPTSRLRRARLRKTRTILENGVLAMAYFGSSTWIRQDYSCPGDYGIGSEPIVRRSSSRLLR